MYLIFDIETTGLIICKEFNVYPDYRDMEEYDSSRIVSIAWIVLDKNFTLIEKKNYIVKRDNFDIKNSKFHGITNAVSDIQGVRFDIIMLDFIEALRKCQMIIAHNILFDFNVIANHLYRYSLFITLMEFMHKHQFCTSIESSHVLKLSMPHKSTHYKYPSLQELYSFYYNKKIKNAHNALIDTQACADCFVLLIQDDRYITSCDK